MSNESTVRSDQASIWQKRRGLWMTLLVIAQALVLTFMLLSQYAIGWYGKEIQLKTAPIDPRDLFYGDYVILNYEISTLPSSMLKEDVQLENGDPLYVELRPSAENAEVYEAVQVHLNKPDVEDDHLLLKARVQYAYEKSIFVKYGLERYYVPEGTGTQWEELRDDTLIRVSVSPWGKAKVEGFITE